MTRRARSTRGLRRLQWLDASASALLIATTGLVLLCSSVASAQSDDGTEQLFEDIDGVLDNGAPDLDDLEALDEIQTEVEMLPAEDFGASPLMVPAEDDDPALPNYTLRLQELEDRLNDLTEEIFRSKSRLVLLREQVLQTHLGGTQAVIRHVNDMSAIFDLNQVTYSLDGNQLYSALDDDGSLSSRDEFEIYNGAILPGPHNLSVELVFVGSGYGIFSYLDGYRFRVRSSYAFTAEEGRLIDLSVIAHEQGGVNAPIEERPDVRYELDYESVSGAGVDE